MTTQTIKTLTLTETVEFLSRSDDFLILTHVNPDGDTCGSAAALCAALRSIGKKAFILRNETITERYYPFVAQYLAEESFEASTVISVDIADVSLFTEASKKYMSRVDLCIDHHLSNKLYAANTLLDGKAAACGEIILRLVREMKAVLTQEIALPLYVAIATDTGCFRFSNTTADTFRAAADLLDCGIDFVDINTRFFDTKSRTRLLIEQKLSENMRYYNNGSIAIAFITSQMIEETGAKEDDVENISSLIRSIEGVDIGVLFRERGDHIWKISVRTNATANASQICAAFGGGGHARAAGCTLTGAIEEACAQVLQSIETEQKIHA